MASRTRPRAAARVLLDVHAALSLRNSSQRKIRGITLLVTAQDVTPGGKGFGHRHLASTSVHRKRFRFESICVCCGRLQASSGVPVQIGLDGVLFDDLSFYGPDKLSSRRTLTLSEWEARRDRRYFKSVLAVGRAREVAAGNAGELDPPGRSSQPGRRSGSRRARHQF